MKKVVTPLVLFLYASFLIWSFASGYTPGMELGDNFGNFAIEMFKILPCAFILIGLFEVWVSRETVVKHLGEGSAKLKAYFWVFVLAGTTIGGLIVAFPIARALFKKGARIQIVMGYVGAAAICRIPMTIYEASFLGIKFSLVRLMISIPLVVISSEIFGSWLADRGWVMTQPEESPGKSDYS